MQMNEEILNKMVYIIIGGCMLTSLCQTHDEVLT